MSNKISQAIIDILWYHDHQDQLVMVFSTQSSMIFTIKNLNSTWPDHERCRRVQPLKPKRVKHENKTYSTMVDSRSVQLTWKHALMSHQQKKQSQKVMMLNVLAGLEESAIPSVVRFQGWSSLVGLRCRCGQWWIFWPQGAGRPRSGGGVKNVLGAGAAIAHTANTIWASVAKEDIQVTGLEDCQSKAGIWVQWIIYEGLNWTKLHDHAWSLTFMTLMIMGQSQQQDV